MADENGDAPKQWRIILTFQTDPWQLTIEGDVENGDMALAMLQQCIRKVETDLRIAAGIQAQAEFKKNQQETERVASILGRSSKLRQ